MAPRPNWKGYLKLSLVSCSVALYSATSTSERIHDRVAEIEAIFTKTGRKTGRLPALPE